MHSRGSRVSVSVGDGAGGVNVLVEVIVGVTVGVTGVTVKVGVIVGVGGSMVGVGEGGAGVIVSVGGWTTTIRTQNGELPFGPIPNQLLALFRSFQLL